MGIILDRFSDSIGKVFINQRGRQYTYDQISIDITIWLGRFPEMGIKPGEVVSVVGRFSPDSTTLLLALLENHNIVVPLDDETQEDVDKRHRIACVRHYISGLNEGAYSHEKLQNEDTHPLLENLRSSNQAGVILFTSGSTGESKAAIHAFPRLIKKYVSAKTRKPFNVMVFLKFDHIGGLNSMLSVAMNGGCMTAADDRSPSAVCKLIQDEQVELFPTTPSFLNMLILSKAWETYDLSSLKYITYGTEPMPESTLKTMFNLFPGVKLKQTYGLTELGIFPTHSHSNHSTFMAIRKGEVRTKIVDDVLFIKTDMAMLGYLNAKSPFDEDGWYNTGDKVVVEDGYIKILGRDSENINVGGEKVYPSEVESVLLEMDNVKDVTVEGKKSPITGQIVMAVFNLEREENLPSLRKRVFEHCKSRLETYKIPRYMVISDNSLVSNRLKKTRRNIQQTTEA